jgi:gliding motility-associated lipoprotein GldH
MIKYQIMRRFSLREKTILFERLGVIFMFLLVFSACSNPSVYKQDFQIDAAGLHMDDTLRFELPISNIKEHYNLILNLEYSKNYPYQNLFYFVDIKDPLGENYRDTIECVLASSSGRWLGEMSGDFVKQSLIYRLNINFPNQGLYYINVQHAMRDSVLSKIKSIGLELKVFEEE